MELPNISRELAPIVILLSCETGSSCSNGITTIAEALMLRGRASAIIAPTRQVSAGLKTAELLKKVIRSAEDSNLGGFMQQLLGPWQVIVDLYKQKQFLAS